MIHNIKYLFKNKNKTILFAVIAALLFLSCANDLSKTDTAVTGIHVNSVGDSLAVVKGDTYRLQAKVLPEEVSDKSLSFSSDDAEIASVDAEGSITAHDVGNAGITIRAANGVQKKINVTVRLGVTSIEFEEQPADPVELIIGESYELKLKVMPEDVSNKELRITSSDDNIAWPNGDGNRSIKAYHDVGEATVTITSADNSSVIRTVRFKTKEKTTDPSISIDNPTISYGSDEADVTFTVKTLNGKLNYTPEVVGGGKEWVNFVSKNGTDPAEDTVTLHLKQNKTVWERKAYIKFKDNNTNNYVISAGKELQVELTQKKNENPNVTIKWVDGIGKPTQAEKEQIPVYGDDKGVYWNNDKIFWWKESTTTKWFNNRKVSLLGIPAPEGADGNQCWAKTASNMLHWWFVQNEGNINKYIKNKSQEEKNKYAHYYKRELPTEREKEKSYIANTFRIKAHNGKLGDYIISGLAWYLYGHPTVTLPTIKEQEPTFEGPALFKDIFNTEKTPIQVETVDGKDSFNKIIFNALESKKAIGINIWGSKGVNDYAHAITLWGAAFDEEGNIIAIYVVDNNFKDNRIFPYGIWYKDGKPYLFNYGVNKFVQNRYVGQVTTLDKGEEQWQDWLSKNPNP
ncbi:IdeS/Mac family cysteine endopeptidase [Treponema sp. Marseille-Q4523]|uniref:IdeS/Mac family cysteine endopeptidase n=1 Tax=Treponema sp. Marseille-Q4523 TaxID=2810610 RepID=UPI0019611AB3|nr:IdeS/Mac family cysteine endopeptidase [Treponema sp. Marseille-Q4523]MBM7021931.1 IdeS/Mac family cysteine endopeptidase [Treponema sp. Marseille-Q4523]